MNLKDIELDWWIQDTFDKITNQQRAASDDAVRGLPYFVNAATGSDKDDRGNKIPFGTGPHSFVAFEFWSKVIPTPKRILEIGFNLGHGAAALLALFPESEVVSNDIRNSSEVWNAAKVLNERYGERHSLVIGDSAIINTLVVGEFDAAFIDGAHDLQSIIRDIHSCRSLGVQYFLLDDVHPVNGDTMAAIKQSGLKLDAIVGANMAICRAI